VANADAKADFERLYDAPPCQALSLRAGEASIDLEG
jgi:hypothetical protein